ncbi:hypothetical protein L596_005950 [Steinernema carpocapsae]|uniref:Uncharacterized protein n=1 Tax=Steinernema carpocapsae TaxID=34508 RepID=A0A4U8V234_STECR|nr:hypothetical protein L596_005950 [Steinernema carpocapsae]
MHTLPVQQAQVQRGIRVNYLQLISTVYVVDKKGPLSPQIESSRKLGRLLRKLFMMENDKDFVGWLRVRPQNGMNDSNERITVLDDVSDQSEDSIDSDVTNWWSFTISNVNIDNFHSYQLPLVQPGESQVRVCSKKKDTEFRFLFPSFLDQLNPKWHYLQRAFFGVFQPAPLDLNQLSIG